MKTLQKNIANMITSVGIVLGIIACVLAIIHPSWIWAELLLIGSLVTDALDGKAARKFGGTKLGPYLDDVADFINFWLHPGIWIWMITGNMMLAALFICAIFYRLARFTLQKQDAKTYFLWLPSPAAAVWAMGIMMIHPHNTILTIVLSLITFLAISSIPCMHVMKTKWITKNFYLIITGCLLLPWIYGGGIFGIWLSQVILILIYILVSILILLIPHYVVQ
jgi:CDP-diacylglycerol---serine O-phosphatidyltransferase